MAEFLSIWNLRWLKLCEMSVSGQVTTCSKLMQLGMCINEHIIAPISCSQICSQPVYKCVCVGTFASYRFRFNVPVVSILTLLQQLSQFFYDLAYMHSGSKREIQILTTLRLEWFSCCCQWLTANDCTYMRRGKKAKKKLQNVMSFSHWTIGNRNQNSYIIVDRQQFKGHTLLLLPSLQLFRLQW